MYLWKYWRESRITLLSSLAVAILFFTLILNEIFPDPTFADGPAIVLPLIFLAWRFGSFGVGHDLDDNCGSYLLTRPRSRSHFVWHDWGFGMAQLTLIVITLNVLIAIAGHLVHAPGTIKGVVPSSLPLTAVVMLNCVADLLLVALIFGTTYFFIVLLKLKGLLVSAGVLLSYPLGLVPVVKHYWPTIKLPSLLLAEFIRSTDGSIAGLADHLGFSVVARAGITLIFPFAAIQLLQRRDVE
jgi:hypothetical protein